MRNIVPILVLLVLFIALPAYLYFSYSYIFKFLDQGNLANPDKQEVIIKMDSKNRIKVAALGDSLVSGAGVASLEETFPYIYMQKIATEGGQLFNFAVPGAKTKDVLESQIPRLTGLDPDVIILLIGINDMHDYVDPKVFKQRYGEILDYLKSSKSKLIVLNIPLLGSSKLYLPPYNFMFDFLTSYYNKLIQSEAHKRGIKVFDLNKLSRREFRKDNSLYSRDQFHPSGKGYKLWGELISAN